MKLYQEKRKWGSFRQLALNKTCTVKILTVLPRRRFSLQYHRKREELWEFLDNPAKVTIGKRTFRAKKGDHCFVPKGTLHRIEAYGTPVRVLEVSFGKFYENDIVRIKDDYGRV
ncbi:MAG: phosphomannose isomerase type II C-terminal cupin domain [Nanoarchaeota archaeon]|nr:phosphomannose isomerase type II C-terminal cupin domain [Nanoarchaeota archaeon]